MKVVFRRIGQRRYAVEVQRPPFPDLEMRPAPGYDPFLPHDLMHMVVEAQLGLKRAVFGQLAAGGDSGTFHIIIRPDEGSRETTRVQRSVKARGRKLLREGRDECLQSERATYICWQEWLARSRSNEQKKRSQSMAEQAKQVRGVAGQESSKLSGRKLTEICECLDEFSSRWSSLKVGQGLTVRWPDLAIIDAPES